VNEVSDDVVGFGPIEFLLKDPTVTEVMVNGPDDVFVEREGRIERVPDRLFEGEEPVLHLIERIVGPLGLRVDGSSPWVDARLPDGSRVHAIIPPLSLRGPALTIRKFSPVPITAEDLVRTRSVGPRALRFLAAAVSGRVNVVVSGGTGSGKTTLLGVLASFIPDQERLVTIEDAAELRLGKPHVVALEARPANVEGKGEVTVRDLVRNALRMRPDRIIVGEVRGGEALDMLQAMNTGHEGSLRTPQTEERREPNPLPRRVNETATPAEAALTTQPALDAKPTAERSCGWWAISMTTSRRLPVVWQLRWATLLWAYTSTGPRLWVPSSPREATLTCSQ
jgi:pilus assembly protein CpaF